LISFFAISLVLLVWGVRPAFPGAGNSGSTERTNLLLVTIDTLRADRLSCYGGRRLETPNFDSLASKGVLFSRAFAHSSTTLPSHTNILLGTTPLFHGVHDNLNFVVREEFTTLAEYLGAKGYTTAAYVGAYPLDSRFGLNQGFQIYDDAYPRNHGQRLTGLERRAEAVIGKALEGIRDLRSPWFVWIHCYDPHLPYDPPEPFSRKFAADPYDGEVAYVDSVLGKLWEYMEEKGLFEKTMVVLTGDHGESLGQHGEMSHGFFAYNTTIWVPLIMAVPGTGKGRVDQAVSHVDIFPTVCEALGLEPPSFLQGRSLLPAMRGESQPGREIYFESLYPYYSLGWAPLTGIIRGGRKFIDSPIPELYDLEQDFGETRNLAHDQPLEEYRERLEKLVLRLTSPEKGLSRRRLDPEALEKLRSLGYISGSRGAEKTNFGPEDDVKSLLPYHNMTFEAMRLYADGRLEEAVRKLEQIIEERKDLGMAYIRLGQLYADREENEKAIEVLRRGLANVPRGYDVYLQYAKALRRARRYDEIIDTFNERAYPEISMDPEIWNILGFARAMKGEREKALAAYEKALALDPEFTEALFNSGDAAFGLAVERRDSRLVQEASERFKKAIQLDPGYSAPYFGQGRVYRLMGNKEGAVACFAKAVELEPDFHQAIFSLGMAYMDKGERAKALKCFLELKEKYFPLYPEHIKREIEALIVKCKQ